MLTSPTNFSGIEIHCSHIPASSKSRPIMIVSVNTVHKQWKYMFSFEESRGDLVSRLCDCPLVFEPFGVGAL